MIVDCGCTIKSVRLTNWSCATFIACSMAVPTDHSGDLYELPEFDTDLPVTDQYSEVSARFRI